MIIKLNKRIRKLNKNWFNFLGNQPNNNFIVNCVRKPYGFIIESLDGNYKDVLDKNLKFS